MAVLTNPSVAHTVQWRGRLPHGASENSGDFKLGVSNHMTLNTNPTRGLLRWFGFLAPYKACPVTGEVTSQSRLTEVVRLWCLLS